MANGRDRNRMEQAMKIRIAIFSATAAFALLTALQADAQSSDTKNTIEYKKGGGYEATTSSQTTTETGVEKSSKTDIDVTVKPDGLVKKTEETTNIVDPQGAGNKKKRIQQVIIEEKPNGGYKKITKIAETDAEGTNITTENIADVEISEEGETATITYRKVVDPKGLMNKKVDKAMTKTVNGKVIEENKQKSE
jgi:hypothetical protein